MAVGCVHVACWEPSWDFQGLMPAISHSRCFSLLDIRSLEVCGCEGVYPKSESGTISVAIFIFLHRGHGGFLDWWGKYIAAEV